MELNPITKCRSFLIKRNDLNDLFVIKATLSAQVLEQTCTSAKGGFRLFGFGVDVSKDKNCQRSSQGHVVVAYKTMSIKERLDNNSIAHPKKDTKQNQGPTTKPHRLTLKKGAKIIPRNRIVVKLREI